MKFWIVVLLLGSVSAVLPGEKIIEIRFANLQRTDPDYLKKFLVSKEGTEVDTTRLRADVQRLRNLQLFSDVAYSLESFAGGQVIVFNCEELGTILPIANFGGIAENIWFQLGANDFNWLGQGNTLGGYYRYYDRHSVEGYLSVPSISGSRWGISLGGNRLETIEPTHINGQYVSYNVRRWSTIVLGRVSFSPNLWFELGGGYLSERYEKNVEKSGAAAPGPQQESFKKYLMKSILTTNNVDYFLQYLSGIASEFTLETVKTRGGEALFWKILNESKWYARIGSKGNSALRLRLGISQNKNSPFAPFVLDSYINVRGSGNRTARGTAEFSLNTEYRHSVLEKSWGAIQGIGFVDWSSWRPAGGKVSAMFDKQNNVTFAGFGARVYFRKIYNLVLRIDYGMSVTDPAQHGVVFGTGHYF